MKRNYFLAMAVAVLMLASEVAWAADVSFSGQFRPRFNIDETTSKAGSTANFFDTRVRLNAKANVNANTAVFLQFQSVGTWGKCTAASADSDDTAATGGCVGTRESTGGGTGAGDAAEASDSLADVGLHQAFLTLKNLGGYGADLKIGRQEVVIDGHRLFGHTGWTQGAETKDAIRLSHSAGNHSLGYTYIAADNSDNKANINSGHGNEHVHVVTASTQGVMGGALSGIFTYTSDNNTSTTAWEDDNDWFTVGARQKGKMGGLDYRVEFYHQFGDAGSVANGSGLGITGASADGGSVDRDAQIFGVRLGKTFKNAGMSPTITLWYDNLSGTDDDDATGGDWGTFDVLYDTGHKFYGFMDFYLNRTGANSGFFGLQDIALKTKMSPRPGWTFKADIHHFRTAVDISGNEGDTVATSKVNGKMDPDLGSELDLTLVHKYDANTKIAVGYSHYWSTTSFSVLNAGGGSNGASGSNANDDADWAYVQIDTKF